MRLRLRRRHASGAGGEAVTTQPEAKQVPLVERLESVPADARLAVNDGPYSTSFYPVGAMAHEAAAELRRLHAVNAELLERLKVVAWTLNLVHPYGVPDVLHEGSAFRKSIIAAIAKAEGVKP
jgi:hypothetical protein